MNTNLRTTLKNAKKETHLEDLREAIGEAPTVKDKVDILYSHGFMVNERFRAVIVMKVKQHMKDGQRTYPPIYLKNILDMLVPEEDRATRKLIGMDHQCPTCAQWFPHNGNYYKHKEKCVNDPKGMFTSSNKGLLHHNGNYHCIICGFKSTSPS